jgi:recombination protein RecT
MTTQKRNDLKNQLANKTQKEVGQAPQTPAQSVAAYLDKMGPAMAQVLPKHVSADRLSRIALNVIRTNPKLLECNLPSLMGGVMEAAKLGLEPGMMGQCYLIPFNNRKTQTVEAQFIIGYRGLIDLVRRSGQVSTISAQAVHQNDVFEFEYGIEDKLVHKPTLTDRGGVIAYYAIAKMKDGGYNFLVMSKQDIEKHRDTFSKSKNYGPWVEHFDEMAKKTVLRALIKYLPISIEYLAHDEESGADVIKTVEGDDILPGNQEAFSGTILNYDGETGEILEGDNPDATN